MVLVFEEQELENQGRFLSPGPAYCKNVHHQRSVCHRCGPQGPLTTFFKLALFNLRISGLAYGAWRLELRICGLYECTGARGTGAGTGVTSHCSRFDTGARAGAGQARNESRKRGEGLKADGRVAQNRGMGDAAADACRAVSANTAELRATGPKPAYNTNCALGSWQICSSLQVTHQ